MNKISYTGYRFSPEIIHQTIWLYLRFTLSLRDVEDLLAERGVAVSYETVRRWVNHFGPMIAADLRKRRLKPHTTWHLDEVYLKIETQLVMLSAAAQREDRSLTPPENLKGGAVHKVAAKLIAAGLVKEIQAKVGTPVWRRDEQTGQPYALKLTAAGAKAIAVDPADDVKPAGDERPGMEVDRSSTVAQPDLAAARAVDAPSVQARANARAPLRGRQNVRRRQDGRRTAAALAICKRPTGSGCRSLGSRFVDLGGRLRENASRPTASPPPSRAPPSGRPSQRAERASRRSH